MWQRGRANETRRGYHGCCCCTTSVFLLSSISTFVLTLWGYFLFVAPDKGGTHTQMARRGFLWVLLAWSFGMGNKTAMAKERL
jgi:hypothetical protein